jgi:hypothetical protein
MWILIIDFNVSAAIKDNEKEVVIEWGLII